MAGRNTEVRRVYRRYRREIRRYRRETRSLGDLLRLMQVRLSLSKVGRLACPSRRVAEVDVAALGGRVWLRSHSTDISVLKELLLGDSYGAASEHVPEPVRTIVDLGANTGLAARRLLHRHPGARVVCVEPEPGNAAMLKANITPAGDRAMAVAACIGGRERPVALASRTGAWGYSMADVADDGAGDATVITMERLLEQAGIDEVDLLKCDIEGAEVELFESCERWIDRVRVATVECHGQLDAEGLLALIEAGGGQFEIVDREPNPVRGFETVTLVNAAVNGRAASAR